VLAFVIGAFFAGVGGALFAHLQQFIQPRDFDFMRSVEFVVMVVLGARAASPARRPPRRCSPCCPRSCARSSSTPGDLLAPAHHNDADPAQGIFGQREVSLRGLFQRRRKEIEAPLG